jgi:alkylhydroperoxidase/carboxymuconolactone decarboxylase family protein YurZ
MGAWGTFSCDRSLITVSSLTTVEYTTTRFHLNKAKENGLSEEELIELITHLVFMWLAKSDVCNHGCKELFRKKNSNEILKVIYLRKDKTNILISG